MAFPFEIGMGTVVVVVSWFSALPALGLGAAVAAEASKEKLLSRLNGTFTGSGADPDMTWIEFEREWGLGARGLHMPLKEVEVVVCFVEGGEAERDKEASESAAVFEASLVWEVESWEQGMRER